MGLRWAILQAALECKGWGIQGLWNTVMALIDFWQPGHSSVDSGLPGGSGISGLGNTVSTHLWDSVATRPGVEAVDATRCPRHTLKGRTVLGTSQILCSAQRGLNPNTTVLLDPLQILKKSLACRYGFSFSAIQWSQLPILASANILQQSERRILNSRGLGLGT